MKAESRKLTYVICITNIILLLSACGSGGGTTDPVIPPPVSNVSPQANAASNQSVDSQSNVTLTGSGTDTDGTISSYSWVQVSGTHVDVNSSDLATATFIAPNTSSVLTLVFELTVTDDDNATGKDSVSITINPLAGNSAPVADAGTTQSVKGGVSVTLAGSGDDSDGTISSYSWQQTSGTSVSIINSTSSTSSFTAPETNVEISLTFQLTVIDNEGAQGTDSVTITIEPPNDYPTASAGINQTVFGGNTVLLPGGGTDSDGTISSFKWTQTSGTSVSIFNSNDGITTFRAPDTDVLTTLEFELKVTDNQGGSDTDLVTITVEPLDYSTNEIPRVVSRTAGVAPLSVFFTAGFSNGSPINRDFSDLEYSWDFGDASAETWGNSNKSKNTDKGAVASHLFENPGSYTVTLNIRDESGTIETDTFTITVFDPDSIFSNSRTTCISDNSHNDFNGCPVGSKQVTTDNISQMGSYVASGTRILLHRGSEWSQNGRISFSDSAVVQIAAYGNCVSPSNQGICTNAPLINLTGSDGLFDIDRMHDMRIIDVNVSGNSTADGVVNGAIDIQQLLVLRVKTTGHENALAWSNWRESPNHRLAENSIISSNFINAESNIVYIGSEKLTFMGNEVADSKAGHTVRIWFSYQGVVSHNLISGADYISGNGLHALKFHGPAEGDVGSYSETGNSGLAHRSKFTIVSSNVFGGSGPWTVSIGPQSSRSIYDERLSDVLIEKNKVLVNYGTESSKPVQKGIKFAGRYFTVRNNVLDGTGSSPGYTGIEVARRGVEATPLGNSVYNNTIYNSSSITGVATGIEVDGTASETIIRNNFASFPGTASQSLVEDYSGNAQSDHNLLNDNNGFVNPNNSDVLLRDFSLESNSPAIGQGIEVPVFDDFLNVDRVNKTYSVGAFHK